MTNEAARALLAEVFRRFAPEVDFGSIDPRADLREQLDIDSLDFLNALVAIHERTGVDIPESDYAQVATLDAAAAYLAARAR
ncbi:MAG TPA: phosphopantetheine-binding protein [Myxococcota bacterium]|nr:phosphopantetheine-binding protein [Myxococcota bacterium]